MDVGLVGLGNMGHALASRLAATHTVHGFDPDPVRVALATDAGVVVHGDAAEVAKSADVVLFSLPKPAISHRTLDAVLGAGRPGLLVIETSTVAVDDVRAMHARAAAGGVGLVDAAILSGVGEVAAGASCFLVGGDDADVARALPVLSAVNERVIRLGPPGSGMAAKIINNAVAHALMVVLAEAAALGKASGIDLADLCGLLAQDDAGVKRPLTARLAQRVVEGRYDGGMPTDAARKDSALALEMARSLGVPLFGILAADAVYEMAVAKGLGRLDYAAIATLWDGFSSR